MSQDLSISGFRLGCSLLRLGNRKYLSTCKHHSLYRREFIWIKPLLYINKYGKADKSALIPHYFTKVWKKSLQESNSTRHQQICMGETPYECSKCEKTLIVKSDFIIHQRTHKMKTPCACTQCEKSFYCKSTLIIHLQKQKDTTNVGNLLPNIIAIIYLRIHTGEKFYECKSNTGKPARNQHPMCIRKLTQEKTINVENHFP